MREFEWRMNPRGLSSDRIAELLQWLPQEFSPQILENQQFTRSFRGQDLFALAELGFKTNGFFVEFGATDGMLLSNTFLLESRFEWKGILAEPARCWHAGLFKNRKAAIETRCVWAESGLTIRFNEVEAAEFSTIDSFSSADCCAEVRKDGRVYDVETISLMDMLRKHQAPKQIDFLSIDTEGSECEILRAFDFNRYRINVIACEHNWTPMREEIYALLARKGYERKYQEISGNDDWYVLLES